MNKDRLDYLLRYYELLNKEPSGYERMKKVTDEIEKELGIDDSHKKVEKLAFELSEKGYNPIILCKK